MSDHFEAQREENFVFAEFIPVLKALDIQKLSPLPFEQGALLNLAPRNGHSVNGHLNSGGIDHRSEENFE